MKENRNLLKKLISMTILFCIIFSCAVTYASCSKSSSPDNNSNTNSNTADNAGISVETTTEDQFDPHLPDADYGGAEFRILDIDQASEWWAIIDLDIAEDAINSTGTALNDPVVNQAMYTRNRNMEEKYNFVIKQTQMPAAKVASTLKNGVKAGSNDYDLVSPQTQDAPAMATGSMLVDLNKVPHLNFSNPWWNNSVSNYFSMGGRLFFTCSDFTLSDKDNVAVFMYNKKLSESLGIDSADALYNLVEQGSWTYDKFKELCKAAPADLNGDGVIKGADDRFGLSCCGWLYNYLLAGFDETTIKKDANDLPYIACKTDRFSSAYAAMVDFLFQRDVVVREFTDTPNLKTEDMFVNDKALFCAQVLACVRLYKNMGSDFGLLPFPKYDETQDKYYTPALGSSCLVIPTTNPDLDKTGLILEALSAESRRLVIPAYYQISIGTKYLRDDISVKMLDIILQNRIYDINDSMYNWGGFASALLASATKGDPNFTSLLDKYEAKVEAAMQKTIDAYNAVP